jgi:hypothetical protein
MTLARDMDVLEQVKDLPPPGVHDRPGIPDAGQSDHVERRGLQASVQHSSAKQVLAYVERVQKQFELLCDLQEGVSEGSVLDAGTWTLFAAVVCGRPGMGRSLRNQRGSYIYILLLSLRNEDAD